jgi:hypothetical protein
MLTTLHAVEGREFDALPLGTVVVRETEAAALIDAPEGRFGGATWARKLEWVSKRLLRSDGRTIYLAKWLSQKWYK